MRKTLLLCVATTMLTSATWAEETIGLAELLRESATTQRASHKLAGFDEDADDEEDEETKENKETEKTPEQLKAPAKSQPDYLGSNSLSAISIDIAPPTEKTPTDVAGPVYSSMGIEGHAPGTIRAMGTVEPLRAKRVAAWVAYNPLYFEDARLERDGYHFGHLEPFVSAAKFYGRIPLLPYMVGATHPTDCVYSAGYARPGDCTPYLLTTPKHSKRGFIYQATAVTGAALLIP